MDTAFEKGRTAYLSWTKKTLPDRVQTLQSVKPILKKEIRELSRIVSRETGKPLWESEGEVKALTAKSDFVLGAALDRIKTQAVPQAKGQVRFKSRGVFVVIGPFNFPLHLPFGQILPALVSGNTVIFKPSEKTPASGQKLAEIFHQAGLPRRGFSNDSRRSRNIRKTLPAQTSDGVLFTGSFKAGQKIKEALVKDHSKLLALEMGGLNSALIWDYKEEKQAVEETLKGCFWSAGQRCSSTSQILIHKKISSSL